MAATDLESGVALLITDVNIIDDFINEDATKEVVTPSGNIPSLRKALADNLYFQDPIPWSNGDNETNFNQLRTFTDGTVWWSPSATNINPVPMGVTPVGDNNWYPWQDRNLKNNILEEVTRFKIKGTFAAGFTYETVDDVGLDNSGNPWSYTGTLPFTVPAGTTPTAPTYNQESFSNLQSLTNLSAISDINLSVPRSVDLSTALLEDAPLGYLYEIVDRYNAKTKVVSSSETEDIIATLPSGRKLQVQVKGDSARVEWFGAVAGGESGDQIESTIDFANRKNIKKVRGDGTFTVNNTVNIATGASDLQITVNTNTTTSNTRTFNIATGCSNLTFIDCIMQGANDFTESQTNSVAIEVDGCSNLNVVRCDFKKQGDAALRYRNCNGVLFQGNKIQGPDNIDAGDNFSFGTRTLNQTETDRSINVIIDDNEINGCAQGIFSSLNEELIVSNNIVRDVAGQHSIYVEPQGNCTIVDNQAINSNQVGIKVQVQATSAIGETHRSLVVSDNIAKTSGNVGIEINVTPSVTEFFEDVTVSGNTISEALSGMNLDNVIRATVSGNIISQCSAYGILTQDFEGSLNNNVIHNTAWSSIAMLTPQGLCVIRGNTITAFSTLASPTDSTRNSAIFASGTEEVKMIGNVISRDGSTATYAYFSTTALTYINEGNDWPLDASIRLAADYSNLRSLNCATRGVLFGAGNFPTTIVQGRGGRDFHSESFPTSGGPYQYGDIVWNTSPTSVGDPVGWVCRISGSPGTWSPFGIIT